MNKDYKISILLDYYGRLLTDKQFDMLNHYYNEDLSLSEIAENEGISRQGVYDAVKRAEEQLVSFEEKIGYFKASVKFEEVIADVEKIANNAKSREIDSDKALDNILLAIKKYEN